MTAQLSVIPNAAVPLQILHADEHLLVVLKPAGVVTQPGVDHENDTVLNALFATHGTTLQNLGRARDFGLIHRLDRPTSGLLVVGLSAAGYDGLRAQFADRSVRKTYLAVTQGVPNPTEGTIKAPLAEVRRGGRKEAVVRGPGAQPAETRYKVLASAPRGPALVECDLLTGRLHQIRVHLADRGHPIVGDREYGRRNDLDRAFREAAPGSIGLHAGGLAFTHPVTGGRITVHAPLPAPVVAFLAAQEVACPRRWR